jgi:DNA-binding XRE family transcriptional regulator
MPPPPDDPTPPHPPHTSQGWPPRRVASMGAALIVATIAALASYSHMRGLALDYGQPTVIADLLPASVDGMMVVATAALGDGRRRRWSAWAAFWSGVTASVSANVLAAEPSTIARAISAWPAVAFVLVVEVITRGARSHPPPAVATPQAPGTGEPTEGTAAAPAVPQARSARSPHHAKPAARRRPLAETRELAAQLRAQHPTITQAELARRLGISPTRLRQVEQNAPSGAPAPTNTDPDLPNQSEVRT